MTAENEVTILREILHWLRFQNRQSVRTALEELLVTKTDRKIYELTDGSNSQPEIAKKADVTQPTVSNKWKAWRAMGIVYEVAGEPGRCRHLASLQSVGLSV